MNDNFDAAVVIPLAKSHRSLLTMRFGCLLELP